MTVREQAEYHRLLLAMRLERREDVIDWADQLLLRVAVPAGVIDVSLAVHSTDHELDALLKAVPGEGDIVGAAHAALARLKPRLRDMRLEEAVSSLVAYGHAAMLPDEEHREATLFGWLYEDLRAGYCGSDDELWQRIGQFVARHASEDGGCTVR